jgi:hypothetical protein
MRRALRGPDIGFRLVLSCWLRLGFMRRLVFRLRTDFERWLLL